MVNSIEKNKAGVGDIQTAQGGEWCAKVNKVIKGGITEKSHLSEEVKKVRV